MKVVAHLDPVVLEGELLRRIGEVKKEHGPAAPVLVVVPTSRLVDHLQRRLAEKFGAVLGVEILHFHGLARRLHESSAVECAEPASSRVLTELLRRCVGELADGNRIKGFVRQRPGAVTSLMSSVQDLREAGVDPESFRRLAGTAPDLAELYHRFCSRLNELRERGLTDEAGYIAAASRLNEAERGFRNRFNRVFLYGAYELIGVHLDLIRTLEPVTALLPFDPTGQSSAGEYAERFARKFLLEATEEPDSVRDPAPASLVGERLSALYCEESRPQPLPTDRVVLDDFQGSANEVTWAVRRALASDSDPRDICILARDLGRYGPALEAALGELPWTSSLQSPFRRDPVVHDALVLLQAVADDFPRAATVELLSSPRIAWSTLGASEPDGAAADVWSRNAGILNGLKNWKRDLPQEAGFVRSRNLETEEEITKATLEAERNAELARSMVGSLDQLDRRFARTDEDSWTGQAGRLRRMLELLPEQPELLGLLDDMEQLELIGGSAKVTVGDAVNWFRQAVDDSSMSLQARDRGGIKVLDAMQARGMTFREIYLIGFHSGSFPRAGREDPFLGDRLRADLGERLNRPLPVGAGDLQEERLLLALLLGSAQLRLSISWQRADDTGRAMSPSPALRELARVVLGIPDPGRLLEEQVEHRSVHPRTRLEELVHGTGMLTPAEAGLLSAFACEGQVPDPELGAQVLHLPRRSLDMLHEIEQFRFGRTAWDGRIGTDARVHGSGWSTTALEELGLCPLRFFFKRILEVDELENEVSPLDIAAKDLGIAVHKLLELIYGDLQKEGLFAGADPNTLKKRGRELMDLHKATAFHGIRRRRADHLQPLWRVQESIWLDAAGRFLDNDLEALAGMGPVSLELERYVTTPVDLGDEVTLQIGGKFDRSIRTGKALRLSDYKTSGKLDKRASKSEMLKGNQLQIPIYRLLAGGSPAVELLGVGPSYVEPGKDEARKEFTGFDRDDQQDGMLETLRVLAGLLHHGFYPLREDSKACDYCAYKPGCRVNHPPTLERELSAPDCRDYGMLQAKNTYRGRTLLKDLQGREGSK